MAKNLGFLMVLFTLSACAHGQPISFISTSQEVKAALLKRKPGRLQAVKGSSCRYAPIFVLIFGNGADILTTTAVHDAVEDALQDSPGANVMVDVEVTKSIVYSPLIFIDCVNVKGFAVSGGRS